MNKDSKEAKEPAIKISGTRTFHIERNACNGLEMGECPVILRSSRSRRWGSGVERMRKRKVG